jgi:hypothetical protein
VHLSLWRNVVGLNRTGTAGNGRLSDYLKMGTLSPANTVAAYDRKLPLGFRMVAENGFGWSRGLG